MDQLNKPIFVVGAMRSGTTLLADLLGESSQIVHCPFELKDIWSYVGGVPMACPKTRDEICIELVANDVQPGQRERLTAAFVERMSLAGHGKSANAVFLNKNPHLCNKLPLVNALFPDARFIWIYRNLLSVIASLISLFDNIKCRQETWHYWPEKHKGTINRCWQAFHFTLPEGIVMSRCFPGGDVLYLAEYWIESNRAVSEFFAHLPLDRQYVIQEEALIENPGKQLESCFDFLGLSKAVQSATTELIDRTRNKVWQQQLSDQSLQQLLEFVNEHAHVIDSIFSREKYAEMYMLEINKIIQLRVN